MHTGANCLARSCRQANLEALRSVVSRVATITGHRASIRKQRMGLVAAAPPEPGSDDAVQASRFTADCSVFVTWFCHSATAWRDTLVALQPKHRSHDEARHLLSVLHAAPGAMLCVLLEHLMLESTSRSG